MLISCKNGRSWKVGEVSDLDGSLNSWMLKAELFTKSFTKGVAYSDSLQDHDFYGM